MVEKVMDASPGLDADERKVVFAPGPLIERESVRPAPEPRSSRTGSTKKKAKT
jgi:hypothetical protein